MLPDLITTIESKLFYYCKVLQKVVIPNSVTFIDSSAFQHCESLTEVIIPNSVTSIGEEAFERCSSVRKVIIPESVTHIGDRAFSDCKSLKEVILPDSVVLGGRKRIFGGCMCIYNFPYSLSEDFRKVTSGSDTLSHLKVFLVHLRVAIHNLLCVPPK